MKLKLLIAYVFSFAAFNSYADCWIVGNLNCMSAIKSQLYRYSEDAFSGKIFHVIADKEHSSVTNSDLNYLDSIASQF